LTGFLPLFPSFGVSFLGAFNLAGSVRSFFLPLGFVALYVAWVCFAWFYFLLEPFFFFASEQDFVNGRGDIFAFKKMLSGFISSMPNFTYDEKPVSITEAKFAGWVMSTTGSKLLQVEFPLLEMIQISCAHRLFLLRVMALPQILPPP
jgi:hypothetical protein